MPCSEWKENGSSSVDRDTKDKLDQTTSMLCEVLQKTDTSKLSLKVRRWWMDHQRMDKLRLEADLQRKKTKLQKEKALAKLTPYERKLLGL